MIPFALTKADGDFGDAVALSDHRGTLTYSALLKQAQQAAHRLEKLGVQPEDAVALLLPPGREYLILLWALLGYGALAVPLNDRLPFKGLQEQIQQAETRFLIAQKDAWPEINKVRKINLTECLGSFADEEQRPFVPGKKETQAATVVFTSGSTGKPAAALHSYGNHYYSALGSNTNIKLAPGDRWLLSLPLYHVSGLSVLFRTALAGATVILPQDGLSLVKNIQKFLPTHISLVAAQLRQLLENAQSAGFLAGMKAILLGGSAIPPVLIQKSVRLKLPVHISYGSTEMASQICTTKSGADLQELRTSGSVLPYRQMRISDSGEVLVKGKTLFLGYLQNGTVNRRVNEEGWFATGDLGYFDGQKRLLVSGRKDRMFISGGENIQPEEIERELEELPPVRRAVVVPVRDERYGQRPAAFVQTAERQAPDENQLRDLLADRLPGYKIPLRFLPWPQSVAQGMKINLNEFEREAEKIILNTEEHL